MYLVPVQVDAMPHKRMAILWQPALPLEQWSSLPDGWAHWQIVLSFSPQLAESVHWVARRGLIRGPVKVDIMWVGAEGMNDECPGYWGLTSLKGVPWGQNEGEGGGGGGGNYSMAYSPCETYPELTKLPYTILTLVLLVANLVNMKWWQKAGKWLKPGHTGTTHVYSTRAFLWIPTWLGLDDFHKFLHSCALNKSNLSIRYQMDS